MNAGIGFLLVGALVLGLGALAIKATESQAAVNTSSGQGATPQATTNMPVVSGGQTVIGDVTTNQLSSISAAKGWGASEISAWAQLIPLESNGTINDVNPSSGAAGIAQFINGFSEYFKYGGNPGTVVGQLTAMANYIEQRYGTPSAALAFHLAHGWY